MRGSKLKVACIPLPSQSHTDSIEHLLSMKSNNMTIKAAGMKKIDLFDDKLKQKEVMEFEGEQQHLNSTWKGKDDWLDLPPSSQTKKKKKKRGGRRQKDIPHKSTYIDENNPTLKVNKIFRRMTQLAFFFFKLQTLKFSHKFYNCLLILFLKLNTKKR